MVAAVPAFHVSTSTVLHVAGESAEHTWSEAEYGRPHRGALGPHPTSRPEDSPGICLATLQVAGPQVALTVAPRREGCVAGVQMVEMPAMTAGI